jgi:hypothetical protein
VAEKLEGRAEIWIGGNAARELQAAQIPRGCVVLPTAFDFEQRLDLILTTG